MFLDSNVSGGLVGGFAPQTLDHEQYFFFKMESAHGTYYMP